MDGNYTDVIVKRGPTNLNFTANSYIWKPNITNCCLSFCNTPHDVDPDWQCDERYRKKSSSSFKRIFVWCGLERLNENSKCSERGVDG